MELFFLDLIFVFCISFASLFILRKFAHRIGLVDKPNARKLHNGAVPLIGGVAICFTVVHYLYFNPLLEFRNNYIFMVSLSCLTLVGALDDKFDISFRLRFLVQGGLALVMAATADVMINDLGNIFGFGIVDVGILALPITILAVIGAINAFNMVDGIDGLLGGLSLVTFAGAAVLMFENGQIEKFYLCLVFVVSMMPYILMNLGLVGKERKVFMGDAGSMMIGFTVIWILLSASQPGEKGNSIRAVTCLWLIALPLMDMASIMIRRIKKGKSPFKPDREHLHHIFQRLGFSSKQTLVIICSFATLFAVIGILGEVYGVPEYLMFYSFIALFVVYNHLLQHVWTVTSALKDIKK